MHSRHPLDIPNPTHLWRIYRNNDTAVSRVPLRNTEHRRMDAGEQRALDHSSRATHPPLQLRALLFDTPCHGGRYGVSAGQDEEVREGRKEGLDSRLSRTDRPILIRVRHIPRMRTTLPRS